jgi:glyoxylase-like metal-dependent hydrolase (beta-lactamase superfamily II)
MKVSKSSFLLLLFGAATSFSQNQRILNEDTVQVSEHVWAIMGFPNVGIVVGSNATVVIDTGLGRRNGATVAKVATKMAPHNKLYLTTTHYHPEHAAGDAGFPPQTILIRDKVQQDEMNKHGMEMIQLFSSRDEQQTELLSDVKLRTPDETFEKKRKLDLGGGVSATLLWFGPAHTKGDELIFVDPDKTLISGDVVQNSAMPNIYGEGGTPSTWIAVLDEVEKLGALHVLPDHSPVGDGSLVIQEKTFITDLRARALEMKSQGFSAEAAGKQLTPEFKAKYPSWRINDVTNFVKSIYAE